MTTLEQSKPADEARDSVLRSGSVSSCNDLLHTIVCGDNSKVLSEMPSESVDCILTSPPYDDLREYGGHSWNLETLAPEMFRVLRPGGVLVWVVGDQTDETGESANSLRHVLQLKEIGFRLHDTMIYEKAGPSYPSQDKYYQVFEFMFVLSKGKPKTVNLIKDRKNRWFGQKWSKMRTRRKADGTLTETRWDKDEGSEHGTRFNIWRYAVGFGNHGDELAHEHPAAFPESLAKDHITTWTNPGDVVLDCFAGSGTTLKAAKELGRRFIGVEINPEYVDIIKKRLAQDALALGV